MNNGLDNVLAAIVAAFILIIVPVRLYSDGYEEMRANMINGYVKNAGFENTDAMDRIVLLGGTPAAVIVTWEGIRNRADRRSYVTIVRDTEEIKKLFVDSYEGRVVLYGY